MSEKMDLQKLLESIDTRLSSLEKSASSNSAEKHTKSEPPHVHSANVDFSCPDCQKEYDKAVVEKAAPKILSEFREKIKNMEYPRVCEDCGEVYDEEKENYECPTCRAREKEE